MQVLLIPISDDFISPSWVRTVKMKKTSAVSVSGEVTMSADVRYAVEVVAVT